MSRPPEPYIAPALDKRAFNCPHCRAFSRQLWGLPFAGMIGDFAPSGGPQNTFGSRAVEDCWVCFCDHCKKMTFWVSGRMVYPDAIGGVAPNPDMPAAIVVDFEEARSIVTRSPRGAAALLRLCIEKLCKHLLGEASKDINADIARLVQDGLPQGVQRALDTVRVIGNECVHAGQIDFKDDLDTASLLFGLVNFIVEDRITRPNEIAALYGALPPSKLKGIEERDRAKTA